MDHKLNPAPKMSAPDAVACSCGKWFYNPDSAKQHVEHFGGTPLWSVDEWVDPDEDNCD